MTAQAVWPTASPSSSTASLVIAAVTTATVSYASLVPAFVFAGVGMGLVFAPLSTALLATMVPDDHAKASGTNSMLREIGVALGLSYRTVEVHRRHIMGKVGARNTAELVRLAIES